MLTTEIEQDRRIVEAVNGYVAKHDAHDYYLQLASDIIHLEYAEDHQQLDDLWAAYGYRDCLRAKVYVRQHLDDRPPPRVVPGQLLEDNIPVITVNFDDLRPIEELLSLFPDAK